MQVKGALNALESLGAALEDHLQLVLPAMVKLISPGESPQPCCTLSALLICSQQRKTLLPAKAAACCPCTEGNAGS